ncbi:MAG: TIGR04255 family protein [Candidatus Coatesbacteria bacterium]|nr:TIGR04255 family protein [Candidatus Coatesbacteria bacterium]
MQRKYEKPPLAEIVCEFSVGPDCAWDVTMPGLIYERVKADFPEKKPQLLQHVELASGQEGIEQKIRMEPRIQFRAKEEKVFLEIGDRLLGVHSMVTPYPGWAHFRPRVDVGFKALVDVSNVESLRRISLRYINRIEVPPEAGVVSKYFSFQPLLHDNKDMEVTSFIGGTTFAHGNDRSSVELRSAVPDKPGNRAFQLLIGYFLALDRTISTGEVLGWVESAHEKVDELFFERCIRQPLRKLFQEVE